MPSVPTGESPGRPYTVALTGATGFIGRALQRALVAHGHRVRALVRARRRGPGALLPAVTVHTLDLDDAGALAAALADCDAVVYCAGSVRGAAPAHFHAANVRGVATIAAVAGSLPRPPRLLLISSLAASRPGLSDYAASKAAGEAALAAHTTLDWTVLRPPAVYGPGDVEMRPLLDALRRGLTVVLGPRAQRLSLLYVDDLAQAVVAWLERGAACRHGTYAIDDGCPGGYGWDDLGAMARGGRPALLTVPVPRALLGAVAAVNLRLARALGYAPMLTPGKVRELSEPAWLCDNSAFTGATGWRPRVALAAGIVATFRGGPAGGSDRPSAAHD